MLKKGDQVVMHTCVEAKNPKYAGKIWICETDEFTASSGAQVVFLEGFSGYFSTGFLQIVAVVFQKEKEISSMDNISAGEKGITLRSGDETITLTWKVVDIIAEASEPCYHAAMVNAVAIMNSQKGIKQ